MLKATKVGQTNELSPGSGKVIEADGGSIAPFNVEGIFYARENIRIHRGGLPGIRQAEGGKRHLPMGRPEFQCQSRGSDPPARIGVRSFMVKVEADDVLVAME